MQAFDDEMKSIDLHQEEQQLREKQQELGYFPMDMQNQCGFDSHGNPLPEGKSESSGSALLKNRGQEVIKAIEGYQNKIR